MRAIIGRLCTRREHVDISGRCGLKNSCKNMLEWVTNLVALVMNPVSLLIFLIIMRYVRKEKKNKVRNALWMSHQGRGA
jgi:hypothetical protein